MGQAARVLVVGCGGIGGVLLGHLLEAGLSPSCVAHREAMAEALRENGVTLKEKGKERRVRGALEVHVHPPRKGVFDFIFLTVPPDGVEAAARETKHLLASDGVMVCFQNGLCEERVAKLVGREHVFGAVVAWGASMLGPGCYERTSSGGFTVGGLDGRVDDARLHTLSGLLGTVGSVRLTDNLTGARWSKLAVNCAVSSLGTAAGARLGEVLRHAFARTLALEVMGETVRVAEAKGVRLEKVGGVDLRWLLLPPNASAPARWARHALMWALGLKYRRLRSSMLAAIERGRKPSVDFLNGEVVTHGAALQVPTPLNARLQALILALYRQEAMPSLPTLHRLYEDFRQ